MIDPVAYTLRPVWLGSDGDWRRRLFILTAEDRGWLERQWELADGPPPVDASADWITYERIRG